MAMASNLTLSALALAAAFGPPVQAAPYDFQPVVPPSIHFTAGGLNDKGQTAGLFYDGPGFGIPAMAAGGVVTPFAGLNAIYVIRGITNTGEIFGNAGTTHFNAPFAYANGRVINLGLPATLGGIANGANSQGQVVGDYQPFNGAAHGFVSNNGVATNVDMPGAFYTVPTGINDAGEIVGTATTSRLSGSSSGFTLVDGMYSPFSIPGATSIDFLLINDSGEIAGNYANATGEHGFTDIGGVLSDITDASGAAFLPRGLNNLGQIVGSFANGAASISYISTLQAVPEPAILGLFAGAAALVGTMGVRRRILTRAA